MLAIVAAVVGAAVVAFVLLSGPDYWDGDPSDCADTPGADEPVVCLPLAREEGASEGITELAHEEFEECGLSDEEGVEFVESGGTTETQFEVESGDVEAGPTLHIGTSDPFWATVTCD